MLYNANRALAKVVSFCDQVLVHTLTSPFFLPFPFPLSKTNTELRLTERWAEVLVLVLMHSLDVSASRTFIIRWLMVGIQEEMLASKTRLLVFT